MLPALFRGASRSWGCSLQATAKCPQVAAPSALSLAGGGLLQPAAGPSWKWPGGASADLHTEPENAAPTPTWSTGDDA